MEHDEIFEPTPGLVETAIGSLFDSVSTPDSEVADITTTGDDSGARSVDPTADGVEILILEGGTALVDGVLEYCDDRGWSVPPGLVVNYPGGDGGSVGSDRLAGTPLRAIEAEFLDGTFGTFDYVLGRPPLTDAEDLVGTDAIERYREQFDTATGQFDIATLYVEHGLAHLAADGRLTMLLPERVETAAAAEPLRRRLATEYHVERIQKEQIKLNPTTVLTVANAPPGATTTPAGVVDLPADGSKWSRAVQGVTPPVESELRLGDICERVGAGVATGADEVFVLNAAADEVPPQFRTDECRQWVHPTIGGAQLAANDAVQSDLWIVCPYTREGDLASLEALPEAIGQWAELHRDTLTDRAGMGSKPWHAWVRATAVEQLFEPKILTRDFTDEVRFWLDADGEYIPRRTVLYAVPKSHVDPEALLAYLNREAVQKWLAASSGDSGDSTRLTVGDLRDVPVPERFGSSSVV